MAVTAEFYDEGGKLLWIDDPYPFKRKFAVGQVYPAGAGRNYEILASSFVGAFDAGTVRYTVKPAKSSLTTFGRPCEECRHASRLGDGWVCGRKLMAITPTMKVSYYPDRDASRGGLCFEPKEDGDGV